MDPSSSFSSSVISKLFIQALDLQIQLTIFIVVTGDDDDQVDGGNSKDVWKQDLPLIRTAKEFYKPEE